jgi:NAD(P)-dependent dehydrogenase (short-subunit alcohol dehydrogenase family)
MRDFRGKLAVITGGGTGMGRELARQLAGAGAHVAICDVFEDNLFEAKAACDVVAAAGVRVSAHRCDVADERQVLAFRDAVLTTHRTDHVDLLFNNAGIGGGGSFIRDDREHWERTFNVCWFGVYNCARAFLPLLIASREACIVNTSSVNALIAIDPQGGPHTAYSAAKFAVKGFSEALMLDLRFHAPHVKLVLVMPGHIGTSIVTNTMRSQTMAAPETMTAGELSAIRERMALQGFPKENLSDDQVRAFVKQRIDAFQDNAPITSAEAATIILDGVREGRWRILIGEDAHRFDKLARERAENLYEPSVLRELRNQLQAARAKG